MADSERIPMRDGPSLPASVVRLLLALGDRGVTITPASDGAVVLHPSESITSAEWGELRAHIYEVRAAGHYLARVCTWPLAIVGSRFAPGIGPAAPVSAPASTVVIPARAEPRQRRLLVDDISATPMHVEAE
jgi:hypothetical protein